MCNCQDTLIPQIGVVTDICTETADVKTFRVEKIGGGKLFEHMPGQCAILSVPGKGEAIFSITSSPTNEKYMEFSIKRCGSITNFLHFDIEPGQQIAVRGPYGNHFPVEDKLKGKDLLFIAGGIGISGDHNQPARPCPDIYQRVNQHFCRAVFQTGLSDVKQRHAVETHALYR